MNSYIGLAGRQHFENVGCKKIGAFHGLQWDISQRITAAAAGDQIHLNTGKCGEDFIPHNLQLQQRQAGIPARQTYRLHAKLFLG